MDMLNNEVSTIVYQTVGYQSWLVWLNLNSTGSYGFWISFSGHYKDTFDQKPGLNMFFESFYILIKVLKISWEVLT